jgi:PAB-dependent poly(A)-specific ribonuclease subunit 2
MAFGDADGLVHILSQTEAESDVPFNGFEGHPVEWADTPAPLASSVDWTDTRSTQLYRW